MFSKKKKRKKNILITQIFDNSNFYALPFEFELPRVDCIYIFLYFKKKLCSWCHLPTVISQRPNYYFFFLIL